ncbi:MAG TPA: SGNH/GDSL hydrolase family protein [Candidatus Limnocylindrales bacterium]|nr:SGNH/GDSL hydrolase family protein [Candidatus Limnocylindrales bacterium]
MRVGHVLLNVVVAAGILLAAEGWCSLGEALPKYRLSSTLGYELVPGFVGRHETVNLAGLRGAEIGPKRPGSFRILAMGGSTTWGHKVSDDETWPVALERELRAATGRDIEVLNGGVSGWDIEQFVVALRQSHLQLFQPDLVVVFAGWNDPRIDSAVCRHARTDVLAAQRRDGLYRSALVRRLARAIRDWRSAGADAPAAVPMPGLVMERNRVYPPLYAELRRLCDEHGARVVSLRFPCLIQRPPPSEPGALARYEEPLRNNLGGEHDVAGLIEIARERWTTGIDAVVSASTQAGIEILDVATRLESELPATDTETTWSGYFKDHAHFTPAGDAALGRALAGILLERQLVPGH